MLAGASTKIKTGLDLFIFLVGLPQVVALWFFFVETTRTVTLPFGFEMIFIFWLVSHVETFAPNVLSVYIKAPMLQPESTSPQTPLRPRIFVIPFQSSLYPSFNIPNHRRDATIFDSPVVPLSTQCLAFSYQTVFGGSDALRLAEELNVIMGTPLHDMITRGMGETSLASPATPPALLVHILWKATGNMM
jgi:hypothetical protein